MYCPECSWCKVELSQKECPECGCDVTPWTKALQSKDERVSESGEERPKGDNEDQLIPTHNNSTGIPEDNDQNKDGITTPKTKEDTQRSAQQHFTGAAPLTRSSSQDGTPTQTEGSANDDQYYTPPPSPTFDYGTVYFHAVISKGFEFNPETDKVFLRSGDLFGTWDKKREMHVTSVSGDHPFLVQGQCKICKPHVGKDIAYKYVVSKKKYEEEYDYIHQEYEYIYKEYDEYIYQEHSKEAFNRNLRISSKNLTNAGDWHQYDGIIQAESDLKGMFTSAKKTLVKGRAQAGRVMLKTIFDLLNTWDKVNVDNFFDQLQQFFTTYSFPKLRGRETRSWNIRYGEEQVRELIGEFLKDNKHFTTGEDPKLSPDHLQTGIIALLVHYEYLFIKTKPTRQQLSNLCQLLCLPKKPREEFLYYWTQLLRVLPHKTCLSVADAVETLCRHAKDEGLYEWILVLPLLHLLKGDIEPFVKPVSNPNLDSWAEIKRALQDYDARKLMGVMKNNIHLLKVDHLLMRFWMYVLGRDKDSLMTFLSSTEVDLLDILHYLQFSTCLTSPTTDLYIKTLELVRHLNGKDIKNPCHDDRYGDICLTTAVKLLMMICEKTTDQSRCNLPVELLNLICRIVETYNCDLSQSEGNQFEEILESARKWRRQTFKKKLINGMEYASPLEIQVWNQLISISFNDKGLTSLWKTTFLTDFKGKLQQEKQMDQIGIYCEKKADISRTNPSISNAMEECALEAAADMCQDKTGETVAELLKKHPVIRKFGKLMSVIMLKSWPINADGDREELVMEHLLNWPLTTTIFQMKGGELIDQLTSDAEVKLNMASSAFKAVTQKFINGNIQIKTLKKLQLKQHEFTKLLKIGGLCDDDGCKDDSTVMSLLKQRIKEVEAVCHEQDLVKDLLQICQDLPHHVKADFKGLNEKIQHNINLKALDDFMEVYRHDRESSALTGIVTYFSLNENTRKMASVLHSIKDSYIFKMCWKNQVDHLSKEHTEEEEAEDVFTLDQIHSKIFLSCYAEYKRIYQSVKSGTLSLEEVDRILEVYKGRYDEMKKDLEIMCRINQSDDRKWISERIHQIEQYHGLHLAVESAKIIMEVKETICPHGDFSEPKKLLELDRIDFKKNSLRYIDESLLMTKKILEDINELHKKCLQELSLAKDFVLWVKETLNGIKELKVLVDLASIWAGENALDVGRVACFHDAVLGYSSILYGLEAKSDFPTFSEALKKLWKALENDKDLPKKLHDTSRNLEWLKKVVKESHGSVELSSLSLATSINDKGIYIIKAPNQKKLSLETALTLQIPEGCENKLIRDYDLEKLRELQNKLMLMSGRGDQNQIEVDYFAEVFDSAQRLTQAFLDLYAAGNPLFRHWEARIYCNNKQSPCITMNFNLGNIQQQLTGKLMDQLTSLCRKMEEFLKDWQNFMDTQRSDHYYLNYFTAEQIVYLCSVLAKTKVDTAIEDKALTMLSFIKTNCSAADVWQIWKKYHNQSYADYRQQEDVEFQTCFDHQEDSKDSYSAFESQADGVGLVELEKMWNSFMKNMGSSQDTLDLRRLGGLLNMLAYAENHAEVTRELPKGLSSKQPNLIICPPDEILASSICLYMASDNECLPTYDEVLLCTPTTSYEQVEMFLRRCLTPGYQGQKIYTMLFADQLSYTVSSAMETSFRKLSSQGRHAYRLVIYCRSDREDAYIPTAFSQFKTDFVPQAALQSIQCYLSKHFSVPSDQNSAASVFNGGQCVGIVSSRRAGVGKSLYVQRLYEIMEANVQHGAAFKKCIRLTDPEIDEHKILGYLYDSPRDKDHKLFHFDVTSSVRKGLNEFLYKLFFLRYFMDSDGLMWQCSNKHLYVTELLETTREKLRRDTRHVETESFPFFKVFPNVLCRPPKDVLTLEISKEEKQDFECDDPLMDDLCFRSEEYQRPYQYLTRFHKHANLDKFTYSGIEGTHVECLQMLFFYCGITDPSWAELRNFVRFLNVQLQDCENSPFCKFEFVGDTLQGFKNFVVEFMILMSKDFATPSLCIADESQGRLGQKDLAGLNEEDLAPFLLRKRWETEQHPYIFFNDDLSMTFIGFHLQVNNEKVDAINPSTKEVIKKNIMTRRLYTGLKRQGVPFNVEFDKLKRSEKIGYLCNVLGCKQQTDPDETYELTTDNMLKMMAIHMRFRCGIPVIIMGETGCGKTRLIKFLCELRRCGAPTETTENMKLVKVHGGTSSEMIHAKVQEAEKLALANTEKHAELLEAEKLALANPAKHGFDTVIFLDEANTTEAINSIKEIMCDNTVQGQHLDSKTGLQIIAACNPYRKHTDTMIKRLEESGLGYRVRAEDTEDRLGSIPLRQLVYRVHALPPSMIPLVWDFGQLNDQTELMYIEQIVKRQVDTNSINNTYTRKITEVLSESQRFMRERDDECCFVSLRDVERCIQVFAWFFKKNSMFKTELMKFLHADLPPGRFAHLTTAPDAYASDRVIWSLLMAIAVCYQSCLETKNTKKAYQNQIRQILSSEYTAKRIREEIQLMQDLLLAGIPMVDTIARNEALKENVFMMVICIELRIPLFIVGKPGTSKSLSKTLVADAMQGQASHSELYKKLKEIHLVSFQCSPHSTPEGIIGTFRQSAHFQETKNLDEYISVVVLDEIGLAEDSPKMPLKTLHPLLEEGCIDDKPLPHNRVGFIGISNWALDPAKMNRGIFVSRGDQDKTELIESAKGICSSEVTLCEKIKHLFEPFANAYMEICTEGKGFFGLRDYYSLVKMIFSNTKASKQSPSPEQITEAVLRNFSGRDDVDVMRIFSTALNDNFTDVCINTVDLVRRSISPVFQAEESRYLLILSKNYAALQILQQLFFSDQIHPEIIFGSSFPKDQEYTQICRNINRVKVCMETGRTVVLLNLQNLYESLYDALNQYYVTLGGQNYVDLGLGTHRVKCRVHKEFRLIVIEEKEVVYKQFPIPLINRLEKHYLDMNNVLKDEQNDAIKKLQSWVDDFSNNLMTKQSADPSSGSPSKQYVPGDAFIGFHSDTCSSVVLQVSEQLKNDVVSTQRVLDRAKHILLNCATPDSIVRLDHSNLSDEERESLAQEYFKGGIHRSLSDFIAMHTQQEEQSHTCFTEVTTFSRLLTAADAEQLKDMAKLEDLKLLSLHQFDTELSFLKEIREFIDSAQADKVLIIQSVYDEESRMKHLSSAKYSCINEVNKSATTKGCRMFVYFVTKLARIDGGASYIGFQGGSWKSVHIDDLRRSKEFVSDVQSLKNVPISQLFEDPAEAMETNVPDYEPPAQETCDSHCSVNDADEKKEVDKEMKKKRKKDSGSGNDSSCGRDQKKQKKKNKKKEKATDAEPGVSNDEAVPHPEKTMASTHLDTPQDSHCSVNDADEKKEEDKEMMKKKRKKDSGSGNDSSCGRDQKKQKKKNKKKEKATDAEPGVSNDEAVPHPEKTIASTHVDTPQVFDTAGLVRSCVQSAVSMLSDDNDSGTISTKRVENLLTLIGDTKFFHTMRRRLHSLLEHHKDNKNWVFREASNIDALQEGGTFTHTLWRKIQGVVTPLLAKVVSVIDRDCNLDLLMDSGDDIRNLWLEIFDHKDMIDVPYVKTDSDTKVFKVQSHVTAGRTMCCALPFSWRIKEFLDELMMQSLSYNNPNWCQFEGCFQKSPVGRCVAHNRNEFFQRYLQDFISMTMNVTTDEELQLCCEALTCCVNELQRGGNRSESPSLPQIHIAYHVYRSRLQNLSRMTALQPQIVSHLLGNEQNRNVLEMVQDVHAAVACTESLEPPQFHSESQCLDWLQQVKRIQGSIELICSLQNENKYGERCKERLQHIRNAWNRIHILCLFVEHLLLGVYSEDKLKDLVLEHIGKLGRVLDGNSDVKSEEGFRAVIEVLHLCKNGAIDQLLKFGLQCWVCLKEPQEPVELPCHHILCLQCIEGWLKRAQAEQKSCPVCRQNIPRNFDQKVSVDILASVSRNKDFRQCCDSFFIELVSMVCFKDNTPPAEGVVRQLFSYTMVETENQIQTKDLSPFDETVDKNPVVRSVILKLLLKYSFNEVSRYLQQHLSSVEKSKLVGEEDKTELYALYINCLEDSLWDRIPQEYNRETAFLNQIVNSITQSPAKVSINHLQEVARIRLSLNMASQIINNFDKTIPDDIKEFLDAIAVLCKRSGNDWYRVYLIRMISGQRGIEAVQKMVKEPQFSWLFPFEVHQQAYKNTDGCQMDQYLVYGQEYKVIHDTVTKAVMDGSADEMNAACEKLTSPPRKRTLYILLALFREVTCLYRSAKTNLHPTPEQCEAFDRLIQDGRFLSSGQVRAFATDLVHNRLGALRVCAEKGTEEHSVIELTVHMAAVLLTGTDKLLAPVQQLGLSPSKMLRSFIPTMPDDMLAAVQRIIMQSRSQHETGPGGWYVCPNNHPCYVGECGRPYGKGKCLDCGLEVGGQSMHVPMQGFNRMQEQQGDSTRPGHILGDPQRRNNPDTLDTKNMSLTPFTLVRLVTHLAMLLGASKHPQLIQQVIQPAVQDPCLFLQQHVHKDMEKLGQALAKGLDDTVTSVHWMIKTLLEATCTMPAGFDPCLLTKESRNAWETTVATHIITPKLRYLDGELKKVNTAIRADSRVSSNFLVSLTNEDEVPRLSSLPRDSQLHSSVVWSCRERLSLLNLTHTVEHHDQKDDLLLLLSFLQKETEFGQIKFLPDILSLQKHLVKNVQNASDEILGSIGEFIGRQKGMKTWYEKQIQIFLNTWNLLRVSAVANSDIKIPEEFCGKDLDMNSGLQYLVPTRKGAGLCATALLNHLVVLHNELVKAVDRHTGEDSSSYKVAVADLMDQHVIRYELEKDLLPLILSNCGRETMTEYDLPKIQHLILTRFLQGKPLITRISGHAALTKSIQQCLGQSLASITREDVKKGYRENEVLGSLKRSLQIKRAPTVFIRQERDYENVFNAINGKVPQEPLSSQTRCALSRELASYDVLCDSLKVAELLVDFLSKTGGDTTMPLDHYLRELLRMEDQIDPHVLKALGRCHLNHCISLWQLLSSLKSQMMLHLNKEPFFGHSAEYRKPLEEEQERQLKEFVSKRNDVGTWLLEMHEFILLRLGRPHATTNYNPTWSVQAAVEAYTYMEWKQVEVSSDIINCFPDSILLSQAVEAWKCAVRAKQEWMK